MSRQAAFSATLEISWSISLFSPTLALTVSATGTTALSASSRYYPILFFFCKGKTQPAVTAPACYSSLYNIPLPSPLYTAGLSPPPSTGSKKKKKREQRKRTKKGDPLAKFEPRADEAQQGRGLAGEGLAWSSPGCEHLRGDVPPHKKKD